MITNLLNNLHGKWKYQQTIYNVQTQKTHYHKDKFDFLETKKNHNTIYDIEYQIIHDMKEVPINIFILNNKIFKHLNPSNNKQNILNYSLLNITNNILKIEYSNNHLIYNETINIINSNFLISVTALKKNNQYIATGFTSYIKTIN